MDLSRAQYGRFLDFDFAPRRSPRICALVCIALMVGCAETEPEEEQSNLRSLAVYYNQYQAQHRGQLPANEKDFKGFITQSSGKTDVDSLFVSNRDGKPFVFKYRGDKSWSLPEIIAYEQEGRDGVRDVATLTGGYERLSEEEFQEQMTGAAKR